MLNLITTETIEINVNGKKVKYYESLGYNIPKSKNKYGKTTVRKDTKILVRVEDLPPKSHVEIPYKCDYCGDDGFKKYADITKGRKLVLKDCCEKCIPFKKRDVSLFKYGVEHTSQLESTKIKFRETNLKKYGVEYPSQNEEVKKKVIGTYIKNYGATHPMKNEEYIDKHKNAVFAKYGVYFPIQNDEIKDKIRRTNRTKYGVDNPQQNKQIKEKTMKTMNRNGTVPCSVPQEYIYNLIGGELNYLFGLSALDIAFPKEKIYVEYDGSGHWLSIAHKTLTEQEFKTKEIKRGYVMYSNGWREIRIISKKDKLPSDEKLIKMIGFARDYLNSGRHYIKFDIDNSLVITSQFEKEYDYGILRKIKKEDILVPITNT